MTCRLPAQQVGPILQKEVYTTVAPAGQHHADRPVTFTDLTTQVSFYLLVSRHPGSSGELPRRCSS